MVWGWSRLTWIGGKWEDRDDAGNLVRAVVELRQVPKYFPQDRWHIERWFPPEQYGSPERWWAETIEREDGILIPALGPYPARGDWEHCFTLEQPGGGFLALTATVCDYVIRAIEWAKGQPASAQLAGWSGARSSASAIGIAMPSRSCGAMPERLAARRLSPSRRRPERAIRIYGERRAGKRLQAERARTPNRGAPVLVSQKTKASVGAGRH